MKRGHTMRFVKIYALEIFTVISLIIICVTVFIQTDMIQRFSAALLLLFVFHEWEEGHYPGGFADLIMGTIGIQIDEETQKGTRVYTSIYLLALILVPMCASGYTWLILPACFLCFWEGFIHIAGIKILQTGRPYTPGMITALLEAAAAIFIIVYLSTNHSVTAVQYLFGIGLMVIGFIIMQRAIVRSTGYRYRDLPKMMKANLKKRRERSE